MSHWGDVRMWSWGYEQPQCYEMEEQAGEVQWSIPVPNSWLCMNKQVEFCGSVLKCWLFPAFSVIASNIQCLQLSSLVRGLWPLNLLFLILSGEAMQKNYRAEDEQGSGKTFIGNLGATYCSLKLAWQLQSVCSRCMMWNKANSFISNA